MFFVVHNHEALGVLFLMWPYLGNVKKAQARAAIAEWEEKKRHNAAVAAQRRLEKMKATRERTHCRKGHEFTEDNIYYEKRDPLRPNCRKCQNENRKRSYDRKKATA
jgi:hypothetical protein